MLSLRINKLYYSLTMPLVFKAGTEYKKEKILLIVQKGRKTEAMKITK